MTTSKSSGSFWKGATVSLVRTEIAEQPAAVARVVADADGTIAAAAHEIRRRAAALRRDRRARFLRQRGALRAARARALVRAARRARGAVAPHDLRRADALHGRARDRDLPVGRVARRRRGAQRGARAGVRDAGGHQRSALADGGGGDPCDPAAGRRRGLGRGDEDLHHVAGRHGGRWRPRSPTTPGAGASWPPRPTCSPASSTAPAVSTRRPTRRRPGAGWP